MSSASVTNRDEIASKWFPATNTMRVAAVREARLTDDLSGVERRSLRSIVVEMAADDGFRMTLTWEQASWLSAALAKACEATRDLKPSWEEDHHNA